MTTGVNNIILKMERFKSQLMTRARHELLSLRSIYDSEATSHPECAAMLPWLRAHTLMLPFRRDRLLDYPQTIMELCTMFDNNQLGKCNGKDIYRGCVQDYNGMFSAVFSNQTCIDVILRQNPNEMFVDISFTTIPLEPRFKQFLTIHFLIASQSISAVFCLMEDVTAVSYDAVFTFIRKKILIGYQPKIITTNFDPKLRCALNKYFSPEIIQGSWFIHNKAIWKKVEEYGYNNLIISNYNASICLKMLMTLPLLPPEKIENGFHVVKAYANKFNVGMIRLFTYYNFYWLKKIGCQIISVYKEPLRTNNNITSFHGKLMEMFQKRPSIWAFLKCMKKMNEAYPKQRDMPLLNMRVESKRIFYVLLYNCDLIEYNIQQLDSNVISIDDFLVKTSVILNAYVCQEMNWTNKIVTRDNSIMDNNLGLESIRDSRVSLEEENNTALEENQTPMVIVLSDDSDDDGDGRNCSTDNNSCRNDDSSHESVYSSRRIDASGHQSDYSNRRSSDSSRSSDYSSFSSDYSSSSSDNNDHENEQQPFIDNVSNIPSIRVQLEAFLSRPTEEQATEIINYLENELIRNSNRFNMNIIIRRILPNGMTGSIERIISGIGQPQATNQSQPIEIESSSESENEESSQGFCMVCRTKTSTYKFIILPCGHAWLCLQCKERDLKFCPYCRNTLESFARILETSIDS